MRRICVFTGSRADYGPMLPVVHALHEDPDVDVRLLVSGAHLVDQQGLTVRQIEADGFTVHEAVEIVLASDTPTSVATSFGLGVAGYTAALERLSPEIVLVLGDRYEALAVAVAASPLRLPVAHVAGGEVTTGALDDLYRHAITKLAHLHFTATEQARLRVVQMGEHPTRVFNTGAPSLDTVRTMPLLNRSDLAARLGIELRDPLFAVTYHPATADPDGSRAGVTGLIAALDRFPESTVVFTGTNVDQGGADITEIINRYITANSGRATVLPSLGQVGYLSLVHHALVVVGNSSSGLAEAPALQTPTVNIGNRQAGRPRAASVIDCAESASDIERAILRALTPQHRRRTAGARSPYGDGNATGRIVSVLKTFDLSGLSTKPFFDPGQSLH